jgi:hypothetical protein
LAVPLLDTAAFGVSRRLMHIISRRAVISGALSAGSLVTSTAVATAQPRAQPVAPARPRPSDESSLPAPVQDMLSRLRNAAITGDVMRLRTAIERNEMPPLFQRGVGGVPTAGLVDLLRRRSVDGTGREMLTILTAVLESGFVPVAGGAAPTQYLWPRFARTPWRNMDVNTRASAWRLVRVADIGVSTMMGEAQYHRVIIGAEGTWQLFTSGA